MLLGCAGLPGVGSGSRRSLYLCAIYIEGVLIGGGTTHADTLQSQGSGGELRSRLVSAKVHLKRCAGCRSGCGDRSRGWGIACANTRQCYCHAVGVSLFLRGRLVCAVGFCCVVKEGHIHRTGSNAAFTEGRNMHHTDTGAFEVRSGNAQSAERDGHHIEGILCLVMTLCQEVHPVRGVAGEVSRGITRIAVAVDAVDMRAKEAVLIGEGNAAFFEVGDAFGIAEIAGAVGLEESGLTHAGLRGEAHHGIDLGRRTDLQAPYISAASHIALAHVSGLTLAEVEENHLGNIAVPRLAVVADRVALCRVYHIGDINDLPAEVEVGVIPCGIESIGVVYRSLVRASENSRVVVSNALCNDHTFLEVRSGLDGNACAALLTAGVGSIVTGESACGRRGRLDGVLLLIGKGVGLGRITDCLSHYCYGRITDLAFTDGHGSRTAKGLLRTAVYGVSTAGSVSQCELDIHSLAGKAGTACLVSGNGGLGGCRYRGYRIGCPTVVCTKEHGCAADGQAGLHIRRITVGSRAGAITENDATVLIACQVEGEVACGGILGHLGTRPCGHRLSRSAITGVNIRIHTAPIVGAVVEVGCYCRIRILLSVGTCGGCLGAVRLRTGHGNGNRTANSGLAADSERLGGANGTGIAFAGGIGSIGNVAGGQGNGHGVRKAAAGRRDRHAATRRRCYAAVVEYGDTGITDLTAHRRAGNCPCVAGDLICIGACRY